MTRSTHSGPEMGEALEAGYDLAGLAACYVALALLVLALDLTKGIADAFDFSILGRRPLHGVAVALHNSVVAALNKDVKSVERLAAKFQSGLIDAFGLLLAIPLLLASGVKAALVYLWNTALMPRIHSVTDDIADTARAARTTANNAIAAANSVLVAAEDYAQARATAAFNSATSYADGLVTRTRTSVGNDIAAASGAVVSYVDVVVGKLRAAEDAAVANAVDLAGRARTAGEQAAAAAEATAEAAASRAETAVTMAAAASAAAAAAATATALDGLRSVAVGTADELYDLEQKIDAAGVIGLVATIPLLATLVHTIATESGLENESCRSKVKQVCETNPNAWADLLGGLAALGFAFSLPELVQVAEPLVDGFASLIREAA